MLSAATRNVSGLSGKARRSTRKASAPDFGVPSFRRSTIRWASAEADVDTRSGAVGGAMWIGRADPSGTLTANSMEPLSLSSPGDSVECPVNGHRGVNAAWESGFHGGVAATSPRRYAIAAGATWSQKGCGLFGRRRRLLALELQAVERGVAAAAAQQLVVPPRLRHVAALDHQDPVGVHDGREPVR